MKILGLILCSIVISIESYIISNYNSRIHVGSSLKMNLAPHAAPTDSAASFKETVDRALEGLSKKKIISLLGSTGSIGTQTLDIVRERPNQFECVAMAAGSNIDLLVKQIVEFKPKLVSVQKSSSVDELKAKLRSSLLPIQDWPEIAHGNEGIIGVATYSTANTVVTGIVGCAGLLPTIAAIKSGKDIALANKETLIAGKLLFRFLNL